MGNKSEKGEEMIREYNTEDKNQLADLIKQGLIIDTEDMNLIIDYSM